MKKLMLSALLLCSVALSFAQGRFEKRSPKERAEMQTERMAESLKLSDDQKQAVLKVNLAAAEELSKAGDNRKEVFASMQQKNDEAFKKILTEEQFRQFQVMQKERAEKMKAWKDKRQEQ